MPILRYFIPGFLLLVIVGFLLAGPPRGGRSSQPPVEIFPDMKRQSKVKYQKPSKFFGDGEAARLPVAGTQPIGLRKPESPDASDEAKAGYETSILKNYEYSREEGYAYTGKIGDVWGDGFPDEFPVTKELLARGQERFNIYCIPCHGANGAGNGVTTKFGLNGVPSYHDARLVNETPNGNIFNTITYGKGLMYGYSANLTIRDRWAVIAYVRTLQRAQKATLADATEEGKKQLETATK